MNKKIKPEFYTIKYKFQAGLNENKLDGRIDMNQQNLNNKTSNHKMEKTKTLI